MNREVHVRFCERFGVKFPLPTRPKENETKEKGASNQAQFPLETHCPALKAAYPQASNVPRCSWMSSLHTALKFFMMTFLKSAVGKRQLATLYFFAYCP